MNKDGKKPQKKVEGKKELYFSDIFFSWPAWKRLFYKVILTVFISLGLIFSFSLILFRIEPWQNLGILIMLFFIYVFQKQNFSDLPLTEEYLRKKKINLARFLSPQAKNVLIEAKNISFAFQLDFFHALFYTLLHKREIIDALSILDISSGDIKYKKVDGKDKRRKD